MVRPAASTLNSAALLASGAGYVGGSALKLKRARTLAAEREQRHGLHGRASAAKRGWVLN